MPVLVIPSEVEESRGVTEKQIPRRPSTPLRFAQDDDWLRTIAAEEAENALMHQNYFVYILTNSDRHTVLYVGVTNSLERRASEHSLGLGSAFARQYNAHKPIYFEAYPDPTSAIAREKQLKRWSRTKKEALIARRNPDWCDLFNEMYALRPVGGIR